MSSSYPHGFANGVTIKNIPIESPSSKANVYWVDSSKGNNIKNHGNYKYPFATIAYAVSRCIANNGDYIYVAPGHVETVVASGTLTANVAGVTIVFLGEGSNRATINFTTSVSASIILSVANVCLLQPRFTSGIDALTSPITITGANSRIINGEWYDAPAMAVTNCIVASNAANGLLIDGWKYYVSTTGTQKAIHIKSTNPSNVTLRNIEILGDFSTAPINFTAAATNLQLENVKLNNLNATPKPGIDWHANTQGIAKNLDIRIVSGTTYISNLAKVNYDDNCLGYNTDGKGGNPIGGADSNSIEGKVDEIVDAVEGATHDSSAIVSGADGSMMSRLEFIQASLASPQGDLYKIGTCAAGMGASSTIVVCTDLTGYGDDFFNVKYYMQVIRNDNSHGTAPETQIRQITDYVSLTGTFTVNAFGANVEALDKVAIIHQSLISGVNPVGTDVTSILASTNKIDAATLAVAPVAGSIGRFVASGGTALGTQLADSKSLVDAIGSDGTTVATNNTSVGGLLKVNNANTAKIDSATLAVSPTAGSLARFVASGGTALGTSLADSKSLVDAIGSDGTTVATNATSIGGLLKTNNASTIKIDGATLDVSPIAGSLARFIASGGTALGTQLADSKSLINCLGTDGTTAAVATAASAASLFGAIGTNEADATTPFTSAAVQSNADGTVLERQEYMQVQVGAPSAWTSTIKTIADAIGDPLAIAGANVSLMTLIPQAAKIDSATLATSPTAGSLARFVASGGTALGTPLAASCSLIDAIGSNGAALTYGAGSVLGAKGTSFWIKKTMTSSAILESAAVDITSVSSGGELAIEDVIVKTDGTGLAGGTNFEILTNNAKGQLNFFVETVANLGASKTVDLNSETTGASVLGEHTVLESGKKIQVHATVTDCTGAGTIDIYIKLRRIDAGAIVASL